MSATQSQWERWQERAPHGEWFISHPVFGDIGLGSGEKNGADALVLANRLNTYDEMIRLNDLHKQMLKDSLDAVEALFGADAVWEVAKFMKRKNQVREDNAAIDRIEEMFRSDGTGG